MIELIFSQLNKNNKDMETIKAILCRKIKDDFVITILASSCIFLIYRSLNRQEQRLNKLEKITLNNSKGE